MKPRRFTREQIARDFRNNNFDPDGKDKKLFEETYINDNTNPTIESMIKNLDEQIARLMEHRDQLRKELLTIQLAGLTDPDEGVE